MHLYLSPTAVADVASDAYERHIRDVELFDVLKADDPVLSGIAASLGREAQEAGLGGRLYVESLRNHACIHILRHYADVIFRELNRVHFGTVGFPPLGWESRRSHMAIFVRTRLFQISATS
jgi:hypothetical protein